METIDYKEKYEQALEVAQRFYNNSVAVTKKGLEDIFPELKESGDEGIRKWCISHFKECINVIKDNDEYKEYLSNKVIAWLEKQGEHANFRNKIQIGDKVTRNEDGVLVNLSQLNRVAKKQGEQKSYASKTMNEKGDFDNGFTRMMEKEQTPAWSEKDKEMSRFIGNAITADDASIYLKSKGIEVIDAHVWLDELKNRVQPQPKQEWSEEDDQYLLVCKNALAKYQTTDKWDANIISNWLENKLKSLSHQPKVELTKLDKNILEAAIAFVEQNNHFNLWRGVDKHTVLSALRSLSPQNRWKPSERQKEALLWCVVHLGGADKQTLGELLEELNKL